VTSQLIQFKTEGSDGYKDNLSKFKTAAEVSEDLDDFPVLLIDTNNTSEITTLINDYISVMTNRVETQNSHIYSDVAIQTYEYKDGKFQKADTASLYYNQNNTFSTRGNYDNQKNQFTLLDVQYKDPTNDNAIAYHLYIPVVVKKVLDFTFSARVLHGTDYYASDYENLTSQVISGNGDQVTAYLSFTYYKDTSEWQDSIDNGENLLWSYDKSIWMKTTSNTATPLPEGTKLTLVDPNGDSKAYTLTVKSDTLGSDGKLDFTKFNSVTENSQWKKTQNYVCDYLELEAAEATENTGTLYEKSTENNATIRIKNKTTGDYDYYKPAVDVTTDDNTKYYKITSGLSDSETVNGQTRNCFSENYYLTIQTPESTAYVVNNTIEFTNKTMTGGNLPTQKINTTNASGSANRYIFLYDFFTQTLQVEATTSPDKMDESNNTIDLALTTTIQFKDNAAKTIFSNYASGLSMYQCFMLELKKTDSDGNSEKEDFIQGLNYSIDEGDPVLIESKTSSLMIEYNGNDLIQGLKNSGENGFSITRKVSLIASGSDVIYYQFPERTSSDQNSGISVYGQSKLSFHQEMLRTSSITTEQKKDQNNHSYYREQSSLATLDYYAYDGTDIGNGKGTSSQLGINASDLETNENPVSIRSAALYDISDLTNLNQAKGIKLELLLYQKQKDGTYSPVNTDLYWKDIGISIGSEELTDGVKDNNTGATVFTKMWGDTIPYNTDLPIELYVNFKVYTGSLLEGKEYFYSNYKVVLRASLLTKRDGEAIDGSSAEDYIVYTNARVYTQIMKENAENQTSQDPETTEN
jgi:hypothetical protein